MSRYLLVCAVWLAVYFGTWLTGDWYYGAFSLYQCSASLLILYFALPFKKTETWASWLCSFCAIQVVFHAGDFLFDYPLSHYNNMLNVLNFCEAVILFGFGGLQNLHRMITRGDRVDRDSSSFNARNYSKQARQVSRGPGGV